MNDTSNVKTVVGIAASAGGLEAMSLLAQHLPVDAGCAYILAQHMSPHHASVLPTLLAREIRLVVKAVDQSMPLEPNTIYVPVPKSDLVVENGAVHLREPSGHVAEPKPSADRLFSSIAECFGENSVGIVLSGTGSDGSYGVQAIREAGGITIAQDSASSKYDTMPTSAIETGCIDLVLSPRQIGDQIGAILSRPRDFSAIQAMQDQPSEYDDLYHMLQARTRVNFRHYKEKTVGRRIQRRMIARGFEDYAKYVRFCREKPEELDALYRDLLISVTRFFRDQDQFDALAVALKDHVEQNDHRPIRVWVPGCATGEEAYSIAFMLCDLLGFPKRDGARNIQIFATDLDSAALGRGRAGAYPASAAAGIPPKMLETYFSVHEDVLRVKQEVRNLILFSQHNVFQDPPFSDIDIVSFRNTLIYFDTALQEKVMSRLLYAMRPGGLLFIGTSENIGALEPYFERIGDRARLFRKRTSASFDHKALVRFGVPAKLESAARQPSKKSSSKAIEDNEVFGTLAAAVAPVGFLANDKKDLVRIFGDISAFTAVTDDVRGRLTTNMLKPQMAAEAASLIPLCLKHGKPRNGLWREMLGHGFNRVRLRGYPIDRDSAGDNGRLVLVSIETELVEDTVLPKSSDRETSDYLAYVESELADAREALQITLEELQTSNEELQSTNEELQSTNEELQSTNEELETSNEELQSTNEELITVNEELLINSDELNRLVAEQTATQEVLPLPLLVVDTKLNIKSASRNAVQLFGLSERGAHMGHISQVGLPSENFPKLADVCSDVLTRQKTRTETFEFAGHMQEMRVVPYFLKGTELVGLTITFQRA
ncbi:chemotaxis protein CheR [Mameliella alba]|nr:chemotaxis protein CheR [Mameliella alba]MBY6172373.1 chemotaxis protein CheR [Mameliella alba]MBY6177387.1 chemotaxis protein CheR [Mameliella alba]